MRAHRFPTQCLIRINTILLLNDSSATIVDISSRDISIKSKISFITETMTAHSTRMKNKSYLGIRTISK